MTKKEMAKAQAIEDIQEELSKRGKVFILFITELDSAIEKIEDQYMEEQEHVQ